MFASLFIRTHHLRIIKKIEAVYHVASTAAYLMHHSVILWNSPSMHSVNNCLFQSFLPCFDIFVEQTKEIMSLKWKMASLPNLIGLVASMFYSVISSIIFVYICACAQIIIILIFSLSTDL